MQIDLKSILETNPTWQKHSLVMVIVLIVATTILRKRIAIFEWFIVAQIETGAHAGKVNLSLLKN